jgi:ATP-dependent 26S proteasome regulatory subunit
MFGMRNVSWERQINRARLVDCKQVQRTMLELINQLDGFDPRGNIKVRPPATRLAHDDANG